MKVRLTFSRRARWVVPSCAVAVVALTATASAITVAQAAPALPARTPAELLAAVAGQAAPPPALTGTVVETASLGIPQLPGAADPTSIASLLSGSHTIKIWYADPAHVRLSVPVTMGESDLIRNGDTVWLWQSSDNTAARLQLPPHAPGSDEGRAGLHINLSPQEAAKQILAAVGPTTRVSTQTNVTVAGQAAYQLVLAPKDSRSQIGRITIAVDGKHLGVPLRVQVFARGASTPALSVGYTSISFVRPAATNFDFRPPAGAHVHNLATPGRWYAYAPLSGQRLVPSVGGGWTGALPRGSATYSGSPGGGKTAMGKPGSGKLRSAAWFSSHSSLGTGGMTPRVIGKGWLSVAVLPEAALGGLAMHGNAASAAGQAAHSIAGNGGPVDNSAMVAALLKTAQPVHGTWGSGQLLHTSLFSILITSNGHVLVGAVAPSVLYAAAAQVK
jgi:hypothetical protein